MMNSIDELYPLLRFMRVSRYNDWKLFNFEIAKVSASLDYTSRSFSRATMTDSNYSP